ncbi:hypothetical protein HYPSUDRAFT_202923 [Hypholoma sublateritium FD-334 SS-4]|uniref:Hydrophobic surface binding protein n=1 Tax=Hypholoma sublateritium (strain FD-334 SS-4) TaxID=945553 RepID=A0A0D2MDI7_HYPSF|nr:hypothetical protein HYPSUDRAFT_202923 [Hypholoma sublateritium FD-334 SS-4]
MVQIKSSLVFLFYAAFTLATPAQIESDIAVISTDVNNLSNGISSISNSSPSLLGALTVHSDAVTLANALTSATTAATSNGALDVADGTTILDDLSTISPVIQDTLTDIVTKKPAFTTLNGEVGGILALVLQDLENLNGNTTALANALIGIAPASLISNATTLKNNILSAFSTAIAAYS